MLRLATERVNAFASAGFDMFRRRPVHREDFMATAVAASDISPLEIGPRLKKIPMSALKHDGLPYGFPRDVFKALVESAGS